MRRIPLFLLLVAVCATPHIIPIEVSDVTKAPESTKVPDAFVRVENGHLVLDGQPVRFFGVNVYSLASQPAPKFRCGRVYEDAEVTQTLEEIKALVPPPFLPAVRTMMFRNFIGPERDWSRYDRIFAEARRLGIKLIPYLDCHWGSCGDHVKRTPEWYREGYRRQPDDGSLSQREFVREAAARYRDEPALLMWQVINEGQSRDAEALYSYAADLSGVIKQSDSNHLVSFGTIGDDRFHPGAQGRSYERLHRLTTVDIVESHDYPIQRWSRALWRPEPLANCLKVAQLTGKPCMMGELGMIAETPAQKAARASILTERVRLFFRSGAQIVLIWSYRASDWQRDFDPADPLYAALRTASLD